MGAIKLQNTVDLNQIIDHLYPQWIYLFIGLILLGCADQSPKKLDKKLFEVVPVNSSGINFGNKLKESENFHYYKYIYSYIGGGVAAADFDNDGNIDLFFTSNQGPEKLYRNQGVLNSRIFPLHQA